MHDSNAGDIASARLCWAEAKAKRARSLTGGRIAAERQLDGLPTV